MIFCFRLKLNEVEGYGNVSYIASATFCFNYADDAMAIFVALNSPEVTVIGLTTIYGNVYTTLATRNALHLVMTLGVYCVLEFFA